MMPRKTSPINLHSTNILDYPSMMSMYEKESLVAEAKLAAERNAKKQPRFSGTKPHTMPLVVSD
jgi:hypothetical protein